MWLNLTGATYIKNIYYLSFTHLKIDPESKY